MSDLKLKFGCYDDDHTRALFDGTVKIDGVGASFESSRNFIKIFERMVDSARLTFRSWG